MKYPIIHSTYWSYSIDAIKSSEIIKSMCKEDPILTLKYLFYLRDIRGGRGERDNFRINFETYINECPEIAKRNLHLIPKYGRWDDLIYCCYKTLLEKDMFELISKQLKEDINSDTPSLLAKWIPTENCSSLWRAEIAKDIRKYLKLSPKQYRQMISALRTKLDILEKKISNNKWEEIDINKIPRKAKKMYKKVLKRKRIIDNNKKIVDIDNLYPYEYLSNIDILDRQEIENKWENKEKKTNKKVLCILDTSKSMNEKIFSNIRTIDIATTLTMYHAEHNEGIFKNKYISFSERPKLVNIEGIDFIDKIQRISSNDLNENLNLYDVFKLIKDANDKENIPDQILIISDNNIYMNTYCKSVESLNAIETIKLEWKTEGLTFPEIIYWEANNNMQPIKLKNDYISYIKGVSPTIFNGLLEGLNSEEIMLKKLESERYKEAK